MRFPAALVGTLVFVALPACSQGLPPGTLLLARVKAHVRTLLQQLPDCTCLETIQRFRQPDGQGELKRTDTVRLQILFAGDHELYAVPGGSRWEPHPMTLIGNGMLGDGVFALHLKSLFVDSPALFTYRGEGDSFRPALAHYDFRVSVGESGYRLTYGSSSGTVGMKGSVWVDPATFDVVRLEIHADDLPPNLPYGEVVTIIDYTRVRIGLNDVLLPQSAEMRMVKLLGEETRNVMEFSDCKAFHADSTLRFESDPEPPAGKKP